MQRRIYFLVPDHEVGKAIVNELLLARVPDHNMHVIAREGTPMEDLPQADLRQRSDLIASAERGLAAGGVTGAFAGLLAVSFPPAGVVLGGGMIAATTLAGAGFGAWVSSMIGIRLPNREIKKYQEAIGNGQILMMVDVPKSRVQEIEDLVKEHHPEVEIAGTEPHKPAFP